MCSVCLRQSQSTPYPSLLHHCTIWLPHPDAPQVAVQDSSTIPVPYGDTLNLQCSVANGRENVTWSWFRNGGKLVTNARAAVTAGSLSLSDTALADAGFYQCFATNTAGSSVAVATVAVISKY